jgi:hypothetical protein
MPIPVITPAVAIVYGNETQLFIADQVVTWSADNGNISPAGVYSPPNRRMSAIISAENAGHQFGHALVNIEPVLTLKPSSGTEGVTKKKIDVSESGGKARQTRRRSGSLRYVKFISATLTEVAAYEFKAFFDYHWPNLVFTWPELSLGDPSRLLFDIEKYTITQVSNDNYSASFDIREISHSRIATLMPSNTFPFKNDYGFDNENERLGSVHDSIGDGQRIASSLNSEIKRWNLSFTDRTAPEFQQAESHWDHYYSGIPFRINDWKRDLTFTVEFDSDFTWGMDKGGFFHYSFSVIESKKEISLDIPIGR